MDDQRLIDVTGLPEPVIAAIESLVANTRAALPSTNEATSPSRLPYPEWKKLFDEWVNMPRPPMPAFVDYSRESIY